MPVRVYSKGTQLACRTCGNNIYELTESVLSTDYISTSKLRGLNGIPDPDSTTPLECPLCMASWSGVRSAFVFCPPKQDDPKPEK